MKMLPISSRIILTNTNGSASIMGTKKRGKKTAKKEHPQCNYKIEYEGQKQKIVINCKTCSENYSMANPTCIKGILYSLSEVYMADYLYISQYLDTMYFGDSLELLERMKTLVNHIGNYSLRKPEHQFKLNHPKHRKKIPCPACPVNPQKLFSTMKEDFSKDLDGFYNRINPIISEINKFQPRADYCNTCRFNTLECLDDVFQKFEDLVRFILLSAYKIVYNS